MRYMRFFILALTALMSVTGAVDAGAQEKMRGVWVSSVYNLDYPKKPTTDAAELRVMAEECVNKCKELGFNAVFLQVRPMSDALYKSEIFPTSAYLTGKQGINAANGFDTLNCWTELCHERGMELHAWINPYRAAAANTEMSADNPAVLYPELTVKYEDKLYYDPGEPRVRELIVSGAREIAQNYNVDGIHFDDYFYPSADFNDAASFKKYGNGKSKAEWRRENTEALIRETAKAVHEIKPDLEFGVSPCGIWANRDDMPNGSDTQGAGAYTDMFADTLKWAKEGLVDYIAPQIYWYGGYEQADYDVLVRWWCDALKGSDTELYIGLGDYRVDTYGADSASPWYKGNEILRQMRANAENGRVDGEIHFRYGSIAASADLQEKIKGFYGGKETKIAPDTVCLYIYSDKNGRPMYVYKGKGEFDEGICEEKRPNGAAALRWVSVGGEQMRRNFK